MEEEEEEDVGLPLTALLAGVSVLPEVPSSLVEEIEEEEDAVLATVWWILKATRSSSAWSSTRHSCSRSSSSSLSMKPIAALRFG